MTSEIFGHKINSLEDRFLSFKKFHKSRTKVRKVGLCSETYIRRLKLGTDLQDLELEIKELERLINFEYKEIQEIKSKKEKSLRDLELGISRQILELREARNESESIVEVKIRDHISRMETLELNRLSEVDTKREEQFEEVSRSLNDLTHKVEALRKKRKNIHSVFKEELKRKSEEITKQVSEESSRRESSIQGMKQ
ncbi:hypothetical protein HWI79_1864 [Cryptosporidium felis]|nr:hypothetical protein HWI79_1864 [Cryptosporidium felis]